MSQWWFRAWIPANLVKELSGSWAKLELIYSLASKRKFEYWLLSLEVQIASLEHRMESPCKYSPEIMHFVICWKLDKERKIVAVGFEDCYWYYLLDVARYSKGWNFFRDFEAESNLVKFYSDVIISFEIDIGLHGISIRFFQKAFKID